MIFVTVNWDNVVDTTDCQEAYSKFHCCFSKCNNEAFPIIKIKLGYKHRNVCLTSAMKESIKTKKQTIPVTSKKTKHIEGIFKSYFVKPNVIIKVNNLKTILVASGNLGM